ncbi:MAG: chromate transporter [Eubacteriales bacterium]|nr:chromate transporter [Eubacteriales bacterium]
MIYLTLLFSFIQVGLFSIGGGYVAIPLIQNQAVNIHNWLTMDEFSNLVTIAEMTPGPIALNAATFVGTRIAGLSGAIVATFGCILPSLIIVSLLSYIYRKYKEMKLLTYVLSFLRAAVIALIASAGLNILKLVCFVDGNMIYEELQFRNILIFILAFLLLMKKKSNPILVMCLAGLVGVIIL